MSLVNDFESLDFCNAQAVGELNDAAVNMLRGEYQAGKLAARPIVLLRYETSRVLDCETWKDYRRMNRAGLYFPMSRGQRAMVFVAVKTRNYSN